MAGKLSKKRIGLYGGTFDPIHLGHINLALELQEKFYLDQVWFIPTNLNPHKVDNQPLSSIDDRIQLVKLAINEIPTFILKENECQRNGPSYTIDTLRELLKNRDAHEYFLLLGQDSISGFFYWKLVDEIVASVPLLIASRSGIWNDPDPQHHDPKIVEAVRKGLTKTRFMDISSTEIRDRLSKGLYCGHLLPKAVYEFILEKGLYT